MSYHPPIYQTGSIVSAAVSAQLSTVELELAKIKRTQGIESVEAAAARRAEDERKMKRDTMIGSVIASVTILTSLLAMYVEASTVVYLAFIFPIFTAPYVVGQRRKLNRLPALRETNNAMRLCVNELAVENEQPDALSTKVESQVSRLGDAEEQLMRIAESQGSNAVMFRDMVSENGRILREMRAMQESTIIAEMMKAIMNSEQFRDFNIFEIEMEHLLMRLRAINGIHLDEDELRSRFRSAKTKSTKTIVDITKELMQQDQLQIVKNAEHEKSRLV